MCACVCMWLCCTLVRLCRIVHAHIHQGSDPPDCAPAESCIRKVFLARGTIYNLNYFMMRSLKLFNDERRRVVHHQICIGNTSENFCAHCHTEFYAASARCSVPSFAIYTQKELRPLRRSIKNKANHIKVWNTHTVDPNVSETSRRGWSRVNERERYGQKCN